MSRFCHLSGNIKNTPIRTLTLTKCIVMTQHLSVKCWASHAQWKEVLPPERTVVLIEKLHSILLRLQSLFCKRKARVLYCYRTHFQFSLFLFRKGRKKSKSSEPPLKFSFRLLPKLTTLCDWWTYSSALIPSFSPSSKIWIGNSLFLEEL